MGEKNPKPPGGWRHFANVELPPDSVITDGGWVVPRPATRDDLRAAVQQGTAEVRQQIEELCAEAVARTAPPESSPTHIVVGDGVAQPAMLDVKACAAMLGISVRSWQRLVERGEAPAAVKIGKSSRWRRSEVVAFIASRR